MSNTLLRDYQQAMLSRLQDAFQKHRSVMVQMPTGTGKTVLLAEAIRQFLAERKEAGADGGVLIVAHRRELLDQIRATLERYGIAADGKDVTVESVQKLSRAEDNFQHSTFDFQFVIIDEAHHAVAKTYRQLWERWPGAKFLGLTATPCRLSGEPLGDLFETLLQSQTIQSFIKEGWLSDFDYVTAEPENPILKQVGRLSKRGADGDYQTKEMALVLDNEESVGNLYQAYREFAWGKKGIVYAINREHAQHVCAYYRERGVSCEVIDSKTPARERERIVAWYKASHTAPEGASIDSPLDDSSTQLPDGKSNVAPSGAERGAVLVNVDIFGEGFDVPEVEFIQLARPTLSLNKYLQQVGRGMRIAEGKDKVVILDHVGMYQSFGLPTEDWNWPLLFSGRQAGKAGMGRHGLLYVRGDGSEKELADVRMVHIKRKDEAHRGLEIFLQNGLYGITMDGKIIHQPLFERVRRADDGFFAYCTYPYKIYKNRETIIDKDGRDLCLKIYGRLEWEDASVLKGLDGNGRPLYWDRRYNTYYHEKPVFVTLAGIEMTRLQSGYVLRKYPELIKPTRKQDIYYNQRIIWMGDWLMVKCGAGGSRDYSPQRILAYGRNLFYVKTELRNEPSVTLIDTIGNFVDRRWTVPDGDDHRRPLWRFTPLTNAYTGKAGFY